MARRNVRLKMALTALRAVAKAWDYADKSTEDELRAAMVLVRAVLEAEKD